MRHFQLMRGGSMSKDTHQVNILFTNINIVIITTISIIIIFIIIVLLLVPFLVFSSANFYREFIYNVKAAVILLALNLHLGVLLFLFPNSLMINQVESNLSRLNFWSLAHLLLMLIVGVSQVV